MEKIAFNTDEGVQEWYVLDETRISNKNYILVADSLDEEAQAMILKDTSAETDTEAVYEPVEDDVELSVVSKLFEESLGDIEFE